MHKYYNDSAITGHQLNIESCCDELIFMTVSKSLCLSLNRSISLMLAKIAGIIANHNI